MTQSVFNHVKITGIAAVVPEKEICLADEAQYYGNDLKKIERTRKMVGFWKRRVVEHYKESKRYFDFGISTEDLGRVLNTGLIAQKESFGARTVVYQAWNILI